MSIRGINKKLYWCPKGCGKCVKLISMFQRQSKYFCNRCENVFRKVQLLILN